MSDLGETPGSNGQGRQGRPGGSGRPRTQQTMTASRPAPQTVRPARPRPSAEPTGRPGRPTADPSGRPGRPVAGGARPAPARPASGRAPRKGPRRVRLGVSRIDPWSVMKVSFLLSVALGIAGVVAVMVLWLVLNQLQVLQSINTVIQDLTAGEGQQSKYDIMTYLAFGRVVTLAIVIGVADMLILTALSTLGAFLYNVCTSLVGGVQLTLTDE